MASLLDKQTNIKELIRICKKFGVKSLVLDEQLHLEEPTLGNLRYVNESKWFYVLF